jgi:hypothetical protein
MTTSGWIRSLIAGGLTLAVIGAIVVLSLAQQPAAAEGGAKADVIMMRCGLVTSFAVTSYQGSVSAPTRKGSTCPQVLSEVLKEGFRIQKVAASQDAETVAFVLVR